MNKKGQIVEILSSSSLYKDDKDLLLLSEEDFLSKSQKRRYSLFDGFLVGEHDGVENFKFGQRKGINVGGKKSPLFVIGIDRAENRLFVGAGELHPGLLINVLAFEKEDLIEELLEIENNTTVEMRFDLDQESIEAQIFISDNYLFLKFKNPIGIYLANYNPYISYKNTMFVNIKK